ncbi:DBR1-domain-containing protein [Laetiporus sulphureus 93-53]|uniref:DBR1-domain-containing protein n=1 Tax=Laetiporus sulphureus 93-53 TaxID=1314785 RepID=A0A165CSM6_9APHY|nr:DBR1-domain-containing protein [Laetiporus sulphureus 93-53]KZT03366.1 DBR1-domain-containing protein [Laetiporus sulphureus 93-53]
MNALRVVRPLCSTSLHRTRSLASKAARRTKRAKRRGRIMKIAIEGCCHGELEEIYKQVALREQRDKCKVDLLLICGDFQAVRNYSDLQCMAVPPKYRKLQNFHKYYTGEETAPVLTIVIGGNHEASNYFWELYHGGWLAPNIYFLGYAGCVQVDGIRIAGSSGIFSSHDFKLGHFERVPYTPSMIRSVYHVREFNIRRLSLLSSPNIFLSHDWPQGVEHHGDLQGLLRQKAWFRDDIAKGALGSPPMMGLLRTIKPNWWFSAHLHCRFEARVVHDDGPQDTRAEDSTSAAAPKVANPDEIAIGDEDLEEPPSAEQQAQAHAEDEVKSTVEQVGCTAAPLNPDEIMLDDEVGDVEAPPPPPPPVPRRETRFIALDKCLPRRRFLEIIDVEAPNRTTRPAGSKPVLQFDPEWLAITRAFHRYMPLTIAQSKYPDEQEARRAVQEELQWVTEHALGQKHIEKVGDCQKFAMVAPGPKKQDDHIQRQPPHYSNPQTQAFCSMLEIDNKIDPP